MKWAISIQICLWWMAAVFFSHNRNPVHARFHLWIIRFDKIFFFLFDSTEQSKVLSPGTSFCRLIGYHNKFHFNWPLSVVFNCLCLVSIFRINPVIPVFMYRSFNFYYIRIQFDFIKNYDVWNGISSTKFGCGKAKMFHSCKFECMLCACT